MTNDDGGCKLYRVTMSSQYLFKEHEVSILPPPKEISLQFLNHHIFIIQRPHQEFYHKYLMPWGRNGRNRPKRFLIDMDDNLFEIPDHNPAKKFLTPERLYNLAKNLESADGVICSTEPLAAYIKDHFNPNVFIVPNNLNCDYSFREHNNKRIRIGWTGSNTHNKDFSDELIVALERLQEEADLVLYGNIPQRLSHLKLEHHPWTETSEYYQTLYNLKLDIGLIPSENTLFNFSKSNIKWLEYSMCSTVTVADKTFPYKESIIENETGLFTNWYDNIKWLIDNKEDRLRIGKNAHNCVRQNYTFGNEYGEYWNEIWRKLFSA